MVVVIVVVVVELDVAVVVDVVAVWHTVQTVGRLGS